MLEPDQQVNPLHLHDTAQVEVVPNFEDTVLFGEEGNVMTTLAKEVQSTNTVSSQVIGPQGNENVRRSTRIHKTPQTITDFGWQPG